MKRIVPQALLNKRSLLLAVAAATFSVSMIGMALATVQTTETATQSAPITVDVPVITVAFAVALTSIPAVAGAVDVADLNVTATDFNGYTTVAVTAVNNLVQGNLTGCGAGTATFAITGSSTPTLTETVLAKAADLTLEFGGTVVEPCSVAGATVDVVIQAS